MQDGVRTYEEENPNAHDERTEDLQPIRVQIPAETLIQPIRAQIPAEMLIQPIRAQVPTEMLIQPIRVQIPAPLDV